MPMSDVDDLLARPTERRCAHRDGCDELAGRGRYCVRHGGGITAWRSPELEAAMHRPATTWPRAEGE